MNPYYDNSLEALVNWAMDHKIEFKVEWVEPHGAVMRIVDVSFNCTTMFVLNDEVPFCATMLRSALMTIRGTPRCWHCDSRNIYVDKDNAWICRRCGQNGANAQPIRCLENPQLTATLQNCPYIKWGE
jgi:hypothetical protein